MRILWASGVKWVENRTPKSATIHTTGKMKFWETRKMIGPAMRFVTGHRA